MCFPYKIFLKKLVNHSKISNSFLKIIQIKKKTFREFTV